MRHILIGLFVAVAMTACSPDPFSAVPDGVPDSRGWPGYNGVIEDEVVGVSQAKELGLVPAAEMVDAGLCPDTDDPCAYELFFKATRDKEDEYAARQWVIRWILRANGQQLEGAAWAVQDEGRLVHRYWRRNGDAWAELQKDTQEYENESSWVLGISHRILQYVHEEGLEH